MKRHYYVGVQTPTGARLVTRVENNTRYAFWEKNAKPLKMTKSQAEDLAYCLTMNLYCAFVVITLFELTNQLPTGEDEI